MLRTAVARVAVLAILTSAAGAHAQSAMDPELTSLGAPSTELADANYLNDVGMGLTIAGLATTAAGTGLFFGLAPGTGFGAAIGGGLLWGIGGILALAGIPTWIVGSVRSNVLAVSPDERERVGWDHELAGMVTTLVSFATMALGGALLVGGAASLQSEVIATGGILIAVGFFVSTFIGTPLWAEGARF